MHILIFALAIILFIGLVLVHEWGHYIVARRNAVEAEEFGLGFPPRAWGKKLKSGMIISVNWLPLGGFVKLKGEHDSDTHKGSFGAASLGAKTRILLAGVGMNLLVGLLILTFLALVGMPKVLTRDNIGQDQFNVASDTKVIRQAVVAGIILPGSPAEKAGLRSTDTIKTISGSQSFSIKTADNLHKATTALAGQQVSLTYARDGRDYTKKVQLLTKIEVQASLTSDQPKGYLGIQPNPIEIDRSTWSAPIVAVGFTKQLTVLTFRGIGQAFSGLGSTIAGIVSGNTKARQHGQAEASSQVGGPVAIGRALWDYGSLGLNFTVWLIAVISLTLAIMNVLPLPALDGGRLVMILISRLILKRPLSASAEERLVGAGMVLILGLVALITVVDVKRFF